MDPNGICALFEKQELLCNSSVPVALTATGMCGLLAATLWPRAGPAYGNTGPEKKGPEQSSRGRPSHGLVAQLAISVGL